MEWTPLPHFPSASMQHSPFYFFTYIIFSLRQRRACGCGPYSHFPASFSSSSIGLLAGASKRYHSSTAAPSSPPYRRRGGPRIAGIVGLPNVGKSTLFNAFTCSEKAKTGNYPFCTVDPNKGKAVVPDARLHRLASFAGSKTIADVEVDVVDVAGLIEGASKGAGLGAQFLSTVRTADLLLHVVRCFESAKDGFDAPDPLQAIQIIENELILSDLEVMEKMLHKKKKAAAAAEKSSSGGGSLTPAREHALGLAVLEALSSGRPARSVLEDACKAAQKESGGGDAGEPSVLTAGDGPEAVLLQQGWGLLSAKPSLYVLNVDEDSLAGGGNRFSRLVEAKWGAGRCCRVSAAVEAELALLPTREERLSYLQAYKVSSPPSEELLHRALRALGLQSMFTVGPQMAKGWVVRRGSSVRHAAGVIHSHFEEFFVRARVCGCEEMLQAASLQAAERSVMRVVNGDYVMQDGDVLIVEHNAPSNPM